MKPYEESGGKKKKMETDENHSIDRLLLLDWGVMMGETYNQ